MITQKNICVQGKHHKPIITDVFYNDTKQQKSIVVFCHGYKGFKDWGAWDLVARAFAKAGFFFLKFNFSHNGGTAEQPIDFPDLEAFGQNNYVKELDDLDTIVDWVTSAGFTYKDFVNSKDIILIGHSRGGGITIIKASEDPRITKLITWASVSDFESRFPKGAAFNTWKKEGVSYVENGRTKQQMPHYFQFYTSFIAQRDRFTISKMIKNIKIPYLVIHGGNDPTVTIKEAESLHDWNPESTLFIQEGADHVFGAKHPWNCLELPLDLSIIVEKSINFAIL
nr:alpha/beta hydrolase [Aquimarina sp. RZ0]